MNKKKINMKDELFSAPEDRLSQLHHEDTRMDYLNQKGWYKKSTEDNRYQEMQYDIMTKRIKEKI